MSDVWGVGEVETGEDEDDEDDKDDKGGGVETSVRAAGPDVDMMSFLKSQENQPVFFGDSCVCCSASACCVCDRSVNSS